MMRYKPAIDKYFWMIWIPIMLLLLVGTFLAIFEPLGLIIMLFVDLFCLYFLISSVMGYVELREEAVFIKFGFILKREIPYEKIREITKERKVVAYSTLSLKNALEHINIKYNKFDMVTVSVKENDELIKHLNERIKKIS